MQDGLTAKRDHQAARLDNAMITVVAALSAVALFAMIYASPVLPILDPNIFLSMALSP
jgi:hypothetical protein